MYPPLTVCRKICSYCNFNKYALKRFDQKVVEELGENIIQEGKEMLRRANIHKIHTIYFGGGTPSLMKPHDIQVHDVYYILTYIC